VNFEAEQTMSIGEGFLIRKPANFVQRLRQWMPLSAWIGVSAAICFSAIVSIFWIWGIAAYSYRTESRPALTLLATSVPTREPVKGLALHEPETGCILGAYVDLDPSLKQTFKSADGRTHKLPEEFEKVVGKRHGMYFFYMGYGRELPMDWVTRLARQNRYVHIALEPNEGLLSVKNDKYLERLARDMGKSEAKIFVRFASEMNGPWVKYHGNPALYREKFQLVSKVLKRYAPNVAMVWCPYFQPVRTIADYYPGDKYVDWVGVNMYNVTYYNQNAKTPAHDKTPAEMLDFIYQEYSSKKPIMIGEYGTTHFSAVEDNYAVDFAVSNISNLYNDLQKKYPRVKAINYFNTNNLKLSHRLNNDYRVTSDPIVLDAYRKAVASGYFIKSTEDYNDAAVSKSGGIVFQSGQKIKDTIRLSAQPDQFPTAQYVKFSIDDRFSHTGSNKEEWAIYLDGERFAPGEHKLEVEIFDSANQRLHFEELQFYVLK
jgi:hypothetical protein